METLMPEKTVASGLASLQRFSERKLSHGEGRYRV